MTFFVLAILIFLLYQAAAQAAVPPKWNPPKRFDHAYTGRMSVQYLNSMAELEAACGTNAWACSEGTRKRCRMWLPRVGTRVFGKTIDRKGLYYMRRHEIGHCNGWPGDHPK